LRAAFTVVRIRLAAYTGIVARAKCAISSQLAAF
jgi:hypothetical protein